MNRNSKSFIVFLFLWMHFQAAAQDEPGLSGFVQLSGAYMNFRTNTVAGFLRNGISESVTPSLHEKPPAQQVATTMGASEIKYTFKRKKWQLYFGGSLLDIVRLELVQQFALRMFTGNKGYVSVGILGTGVPVFVWTDPYVSGREREATARDALGFRFQWLRIGQTNFGVQYDFRANAMEEKSGAFLGLPETEKNLLDRNGFDQRINIQYLAEISAAHALILAVTYKHINANGAARKGHGIGADLTYGYTKDRWTSAGNIAFGYRTYAAENPVYQIEQRNLEFSVTGNVFYRINNNPKATWLITGSASFVLADSNIDFHAQSGLLFQAGLIFKFGPILSPKDSRDTIRE